MVLEAGGGGTPIAANATTVIELPTTGTSQTAAWLDLTLPPGVVGYAVLRQSVQGQPDQETVIPLNSVASQNADLLFDDIALTTIVALVNPGTASITVAATAYNDDGSQLGIGSLTIAARSKVASSLRSLDGLAGVAGSRGRVTFTASNGSLAALGLRVGAAAFSALPVNYR